MRNIDRPAEAFRLFGAFILGVGAPFAFDFQISPGLCGLLASLCFLIGFYMVKRAEKQSASPG